MATECRMPFRYVVYVHVCSDNSLSKEHLGSRGVGKHIKTN